MPPGPRVAFVSLLASEWRSTISPRAFGPERGEPRLGVGDHTVGMLVSGGGRKNQELRRHPTREQLGVVVGACLPLAPTDEGEHTWRGRLPGLDRPSYCFSLIAHGAGTYTLPGGKYLADPIEPDSTSRTQIDPFFTSTGPGRSTRTSRAARRPPRSASPWLHSTGTPPAAASSFAFARRLRGSDPSRRNSAMPTGRAQADREGSKSRQAAFGAARQQQRGPGLSPARGGPPRARAWCSGLEVIRQAPEPPSRRDR